MISYKKYKYIKENTSKERRSVLPKEVPSQVQTDYADTFNCDTLLMELFYTRVSLVWQGLSEPGMDRKDTAHKPTTLS